jgi:hypothetical protein
MGQAQNEDGNGACVTRQIGRSSTPTWSVPAGCGARHTPGGGVGPFYPLTLFFYGFSFFFLLHFPNFQKN